MTCFIVTFTLLQWSRTEPAVSPKYAYDRKGRRINTKVVLTVYQGLW